MSIILNPETDQSPFRFFVRVNRAVFPLVVANVVFYCLGALALLLASYFLGQVIDVLNGTSDAPLQNLAMLLIVSIFLHELFYRFGHICEIASLARIRANTKKALFHHTSSLSFGYFTDRFAGEIAHKVSTTADGFERIMLVLNNDFAVNTMLIFLTTIVLGRIHPAYAVFLGLWWAVFLAGSLLLARKLHDRASLFAAAEAKTTGAVVDIYGNIGAFKVYGQPADLFKTEAQIDAERQAYTNLGVWDVVMFHFQGLSLVALCTGLVLITGSLFTRDLVTVGAIVFIATLAFQIFNTIWTLGKNLADFIRYRGEIVQGLTDLVYPPTIFDGPATRIRSKQAATVTYRQVTFGYTKERPVLNNFSLMVKAKEKVGIVGLSGAGKTTFAHLLLRFFDPQHGTISINNQNINELTQVALRSHISYIAQDTSLFHASIAANIAFGVPKASRSAIKQAARLAFADDFIATLPDGYESVVGERGVKLSGGQRQRIAIARAILADRPLFLLDEATSALDSDSEAKIQKGLKTLMANKTVIAIAHRLSTLAHMDRIIFLADGKIVEDGTHADLLKKKGNYAALWRMQAGGFLPDVDRLPKGKVS